MGIKLKVDVKNKNRGCVKNALYFLLLEKEA